MRGAALALTVLLLLPSASADDPDPPELISLSLAKTTYEPGDTLEVTMEWQDASGVRYVDARAKGPNDLEVNIYDCDDPGERRVVTVVCRGRIPDRAPGGEYRVHHAWAQDTVGHVANIFQDTPFTVVSPFNDTSAPTLIGVEVHVAQVETTPQGPDEDIAMHFEDALTLWADDENGLRDGSMRFVGPGGNDGVWAQCGIPADEALTCSLHVMRGSPSGEYALHDVGISDTVGYRSAWSTEPARYGSDLATAIGEIPSIFVSNNGTDATPPTLLNITFPGELYRGQEFLMYINGTDETGLMWVAAGFRTSRGNADFHVETQDCQGDWGTDIRLVCRAAFPSNYPLGLAYITSVYMADAAYNYRHYTPVEWGWHGEHKFQDDDGHDVATILVPRPVEGVIEAVDAIQNEVVPGELATIVYKVQDRVDEVTFTLANQAGDVIEATCSERAEDVLGRACDVPIPEAEGVFSLEQASATSAGNVEATTYADPVPVLAVGTSMPPSTGFTTATGGGADNKVGDQYGSKAPPPKATRPAESEPRPAEPKPTSEPAATEPSTATNGTTPPRLNASSIDVIPTPPTEQVAPIFGQPEPVPPERAEPRTLDRWNTPAPTVLWSLMALVALAARRR